MICVAGHLLEWSFVLLRLWLEAQFVPVPEIGPHLLRLLVSPPLQYHALLPATSAALNQWLASNASSAPEMMEQLCKAYREQMVGGHGVVVVVPMWLVHLKSCFICLAEASCSN